MTDIVYMSKFWPTPKEPARVTVSLTVTPSEPNEDGKSDSCAWDWRSEVTLPDGSSRGGGGVVVATTEKEAHLDAMYKLVTLLGEMLADATEHVERRR